MKNPFSADARAKRLVEKHDAQVVCHHCGAGGLLRVRNGYLVKVGNSYRHSDPRACALVMNKRAS